MALPQTPELKKNPIIQPPLSPASPTATVPVKKEGYGVTLGGLKGIRSQVESKREQTITKNEIPKLNHGNMITEWNHVAALLAKEKGTSVISFMESELELKEETIYIFAPLSIMEFVKGKRIFLLDFFKKSFYNENINVLIEEKKLDLNHQPQVASTREIYEEMVKKNPILQQLKDRLRFDFDL